MKRYIILSLLVVSTGLSSCKKGKWPRCVRGKGPVKTEVRTASYADAVHLNGAFDLTLTEDSNATSTTIEIETHERVLELLETEVKGGELFIDLEGCTKGSVDIDVHVTMPAITGINLNGSGNISSTNIIRNGRLKIDLNGSGNVDLKVALEDLETHINGSGDVKLSGSSEIHDVTINGSGNVHAYSLQTGTSIISIIGSGDCEVNVSGKLDVNINGSGDVRYRGAPSVVNLDGSGSGSVKQG